MGYHNKAPSLACPFGIHFLGINIPWKYSWSYSGSEEFFPDCPFVGSRCWFTLLIHVFGSPEVFVNGELEGNILGDTVRSSVCIINGRSKRMKDGSFDLIFDSTYVQ